jgi:phospho-N-acetylmuramoyl-pentapeptide-transferase
MRGILLAGAFSAILAFLLSPLLIKVLTRRGIGQVIRTDGPTTHQVKSGTPTMGGVAIIFAATMGYLASHIIIGVPRSWYSAWSLESDSSVSLMTG